MMMMMMVMRMVADVMVVGVDTVVVVISEGMEVVGGNGRVNDVITLPTTCL